MFIRIKIFSEPDASRVTDEYIPTNLHSKNIIKIFNMSHSKRDDPDRYNFKTKLITLNTNHIVSVYPIKYMHADDSFEPMFDGWLITDVNNNTYVSPTSDLDLHLMEHNTQQFDFFTYDQVKEED